MSRRHDPHDRSDRRPASRRAGRVRALVLTVALAATATACTGADDGPPVREVRVDGGSELVVATAAVQVPAQPGDTIRITNANGGPAAGPDGEARPGTVVHALTSAEDRLPPIFVEVADGAIPNPAVWGACRGGDAVDAVGGCPMPSVDGPAAWDGSAYWSTGAMLPGESREVPLAEDLAPGTHRLVCALHPDLAVEVVVGTSEESVEESADASEAPEPAPLDQVVPPVEAAPAGDATVVVAPSEAGTTALVFWPDIVEVPVGGTVTWTTDVRSPHDVVLAAAEPPDLAHTEADAALPTFPDEPWDGTSEVRSGFLSTDPSAPGGDRVHLVFAEPGTYPYLCRFHPDMTGTVVVRQP